MAEFGSWGWEAGKNNFDLVSVWVQDGKWLWVGRPLTRFRMSGKGLSHGGTVSLLNFMKNSDP